MTALDLVRRIRANPHGSDFQDVKLVEEFVEQRIQQWQAQHSVDTEPLDVQGVPPTGKGKTKP